MGCTVTHHHDHEYPEPFLGPKRSEGISIFTIFGSIVAFVLASFVFGRPGIIGFFVVLLIAAIIVWVVTPRDISVTLARVVAFLIWAVLFMLMFLTGIALLIATLLSPIAQAMQDSGTHAGATVNFIWLFVMVV